MYHLIRYYKILGKVEYIIRVKPSNQIEAVRVSYLKIIHLELRNVIRVSDCWIISSIDVSLRTYTNISFLALLRFETQQHGFPQSIWFKLDCVHKWPKRRENHEFVRSMFYYLREPIWLITVFCCSLHENPVLWK